MKKNIIFICFLFVSCASLEKNRKYDNPEVVKIDNELMQESQNSSSDILNNIESANTVEVEKDEHVEFIPMQTPIQDKPNLELVIPQDDEAVLDEPVVTDDGTVNNSEIINDNKSDVVSEQEQSDNVIKQPIDDKKNQFADTEKIESENENISSDIFPENKLNSDDNNILDNIFIQEPEFTEKTASENFDDEKKVEFFSEFPSTEPDNSKDIKVSRYVKLKKGQRLEITYPGEGWVYLGELSAQKGIKYQQRKLQNNSSLFHFGTEKAGSYILNFSHFDVFSDKFISDAVSVEVEDSVDTKLGNTITAPPYIDKSDSFIQEQPAEIKNNQKYNEKNKSVEPVEPENNRFIYDKNNTNISVNEPPDLEKSLDEINTDTKSDIIPDEILQKVEQFILSGDALSALNKLEEFFVKSSYLLDKALFLRGKAYEINGKEKNIKLALKSYKNLCEAYPESPYWNQADERIRYINRFYININ